jgi:hypothetical protein
MVSDTYFKLNNPQVVGHDGEEKISETSVGEVLNRVLVRVTYDTGEKEKEIFFKNLNELNGPISKRQILVQFLEEVENSFKSCEAIEIQLTQKDSFLASDKISFAAGEYLDEKESHRFRLAAECKSKPLIRTFVHELMHFLLTQRHHNKSLPYGKEDAEGKKLAANAWLEFDELSRSKDVIIKNELSLPEISQAADILKIVKHLINSYSGDNLRQKEVLSHFIEIIFIMTIAGLDTDTISGRLLRIFPETLNLYNYSRKSKSVN